jgi:RHS repeat-associated protein
MSIDGQMNSYIYAADGRKLRTAQGTTKSTDYCGNFIYENNTLKYILVDGGYIDASTGTYYFFLTDHLGNNRVVASASGTAVQVNHYYPYGMLFAEEVTSDGQPYKYAGKEFDTSKNLFWSDFGARHYYGTVPGFTTMDPRAEYYYGMSPYAYCGGEPMNRVDKNGEFFLTSFVIGFLEGLFTTGSFFKGIEYGAERFWHQTKIFGGLFIGTPEQIFSRWTIEIVQTFFGFLYTSGKNVVGRVDTVEYFDGATYAINENSSLRSGISMGSFIGINDWGKAPRDAYGNFAPYLEFELNPDYGSLYMHEYGHYLQSQQYGFGYMVSVGFPSGWDILFDNGSSRIEDERNLYGLTDHDVLWFERRANKKAAEYFKKYGVSWNENLSPIKHPFRD